VLLQAKEVLQWGAGKILASDPRTCAMALAHAARLWTGRYLLPKKSTSARPPSAGCAARRIH